MAKEKPIKPPKANTSKIEEIRHKRKMKRIKFAVLLSAIVCITLVFVLTNVGSNTVAFFADTFESIQLAIFGGGSFPANVSVENILDADEVSGSIAVLGKKELAIYSPTGGLATTIQHGYATPKITTSNKRVCVYNLGGNEMRIEGRKNSVAVQSFNQPIYFAEYSKNGNLAVATGSDTHKTELTVLSSGLEEIFKFKLSNDYPLNISFSQDSKTMALGCVAPENGKLKAVIYLLGLKDDKEKAKVERVGSLPLYSRFINNSSLLVAYDNCAVVYSTRDLSEKAVYTYPDSLISVSEQEGQNTAFLFGDEKQTNRNICVVLDSELNTLATTKASAAVKKVFITQKEVYIFANDCVFIYNLKEQAITKTPLEEFTVDMVFTKEPILVTNKQLKKLSQYEQEN